MCVWYAMGCPTIFIQSHYDCRDLGEDASTNEALSGWIWRNPWRCGYELRCWTPSGDGRCRVDVESGWELPGFPTSHPSWIFGSRQLRQDWEIKKQTSDPLSKLMLLWKMNTDGESTNFVICSRKSLADAGGGFHRRYKKEKVLQIHWVSRFVVSLGAGYSLWFFNCVRTGKPQFYLISKPS
jgi:hypothetical protein